MSKSYPSPHPALGTLGKLPLETRWNIYDLVFPTSLSLFFASKVLSTETKTWLYQHGIYRPLITFHRATTARESSTYYTISDNHSASSYPELPRPCIPAPEILAQIQNVEICIDMPEPYNHCRFEPWTHHTWGPGGFITDVVERIVTPMNIKESCRLTFVLGSLMELHPFHEPEVLDCLALIGNFKTAVVDFRKKPWIGDYPRSFGKRHEAENDAHANRLHNLTTYLGYGQQMQRNKTLKIVRTTSPRGNEEVLWEWGS